MLSTRRPCPLRLARLTRDQKRALFAQLAGHPASPLTPAQKVAILRCLLDPHWEPREEESPVVFETVEEWYNDVFGARRSA